MERKKIGQDNRGMTMVEILTALVIVVMLMSVLGYIFLSSMDYMTYFGGKRNEKLMADSILEYFTDSVSMATDIYLTDTLKTPDGWDEAESAYICFGSQAEGGIVSTNTLDSYFSKELYENRTLSCTLSFDNEVDNAENTGGKNRTVTVSLQFYDGNGELVYKRNRVVNVVNMTYFRENIAGTKNSVELEQKTEVNNTDAPLYLYYKKTPNDGSEYKESEIWQIFQKLYYDNTALDPDMYLTFPEGTKIATEGTVTKTIGPVAQRHGLLMWQFRASNEKVYEGQDWGNLKTAQQNHALMEMDPERFSNWGITKLNGIDVTSRKFYMVAYHYVLNQEKCDVLFYVYDSYYFDNLESGKPRVTQLIYNNEEDTWYYLPIGGDALCQSITRGYNSFKGLPIDEDKELTYVIKNGEKSTKYTTTFTSSYQIKLFFKKYGTALTRQ